MPKKIFRQGDVLLVEVEPTKTIAIGNGITLAEGEFSGHHHILYAQEGDVEIAEVELNRDYNRFRFMWSNNKDVGVGNAPPQVVHLPFGGELKHQNVNQEFAWTGEHFDLPIPAGYYKVVQQRQFDYLSSLARRVND